MTLATRYTKTAMFLHWLVAILMVGNVVLAWIVDDLPDAATRPVIDTHKSIGITVLGLAFLRLLWRYAHRPPALPASYPGWERVSAHLAHWALYLLIFALPISGWMHDSAWKDGPTHPMFLFWLVPWPRIAAIADLDPATKEHMHDLFYAVHEALAYGLYVVFALHVAGALKHQFLDKEPELQRMLP
jgi:cytochrome b561